MVLSPAGWVKWLLLVLRLGWNEYSFYPLSVVMRPACPPQQTSPPSAAGCPGWIPPTLGWMVANSVPALSRSASRLFSLFHHPLYMVNELCCFLYTASHINSWHALSLEVYWAFLFLHKSHFLNLARKLHHWDLNSEISHVHLAMFHFQVFSVGLSIS